METIPMRQLSPLQSSYKLLEMFMALPEAVGAVTAVRGPEASVGIRFSTPEGDNLDWNAVLGDSAAAFSEALRRWLLSLDEDRTSAYFCRGGGNAVFGYTYYPYRAIFEEERQIVYRDDLPLPKPIIPSFVNYNTRPLKGRVERAIMRYPLFWSKEAPKGFREKYPEQPTVEALLEMGRIKDYWHRVEVPAAEKFLRELIAETRCC